MVFLTIELLRPPREAAIPPPPKNLLAVPTTPGVPFDPDDPPGAASAPGQPGAGAGQGLGGIFGQLQQQMQQAFKGFGRGGAGGPNTFSFRLGGDDADLDVQEDPDSVIVVAKVKGAIAEKFDIQVDGRMFTLRGERRIGGGAMTGTMSFSKSVSLPSEVDVSKMISEVKDGELRVRFPKK